MEYLSDFNHIYKIIREECSPFNKDTPSEAVLTRLKEPINNVSHICIISKEIIRDVFYIGTSTEEDNDNVIDFIIDLSKCFYFRNNEECAKKLLKLVLEYDPKCYRALCEMEHILCDEEYSKEYLELLRSIIEIGTEQGEESLSKYTFRLSQREEPARDLEHASIIAYFKERNKLQRLYPNAYISHDSVNCQIQVWMGDKNIELPTHPSVKVGEKFDIKIKFLLDKVEKL